MNGFMIRADDLGFSEAVNYGIQKTVESGMIRNIGFMVNMASSIHGWKLVKDFDICLGQHTNICVGKPITDPSKIPSLVQENGEFKSSSIYRNAKEDFVVLDEAVLEIEAQYQRFVEITGREPEYFEGHAVASNHFFQALEVVADRHGLRYQPASFDGSATLVKGHKVYFWMDSMGQDYDPAKAFRKMIENAHEDGVDLMIFHPGYLDDYILTHSSLTVPRTRETAFLTSEDFSAYVKEKGISFLLYRDII